MQDARRVPAKQTQRDGGFGGFVGEVTTPRQVMQKNHRIRLGDGVPAAANADALYLVSGLAVGAQAGCVHDVQRHAFNLDGLADLVAGGAGHAGDDGQLSPGQRIEQAAFAHVGLAGQHHLQALAQQHALAGAGHHVGQGGVNGVELAVGVGTLQKVNLFFGEVQRGLHQRTQAHGALAQGVDLVGERAGQAAPGRARCGLGAGVDQVGHGFGLGQVQLVVQEGALGELTRAGQAQVWAAGLAGAGVQLSGRLQAAGQQQLQHHRATVGLQFQHILTGVGVRRGEPQRQALVDNLAIGRPERQVAGLAWWQRAAAQRFNQRCKAHAGHPHDAHRTAARGGGDGGDGVLLVVQHRRDCRRAAGAQAAGRRAPTGCAWR